MIQNNKPLINIAKKEYRYNLIQNIIIGSIILSITILNTIISSISISMYKYSLGEKMFTLIIAISMIIIFYGFIILSSIFYLKLSWSSDFWITLNESGLTYSEIKKIIIYENIINGLLGISSGIIIGIFLSIFTVNKLFQSTSFIKINWVVILIISCVLAIILTLISLLLASFFQGIKLKNILNKFSINKDLEFNGKKSSGSKLYKMAWRNIRRERDKVFVIVGFICIGLIILNTIFTITSSSNIKETVEAAINVDFFLTGIDTSKDELREKEQYVPQSIINKIESDENFKEGGRLYHNLDYYNVTLKTDKLPEVSGLLKYEFQKDSNDNYFVNLYGADDFVMSKLEIIDGTLDYDKLKSGKYIIYGVERDKNGTEYAGEISKEWDYYNVGDKITLCYEKSSKEYEILAKCVVNHSTSEQLNPYYVGTEVTFYLPSLEYLSYINDNVMRYLFNSNNINKMEKNLKEYIANSDVLYESKLTWKNKYRNEEKIINLVGIIFCIIIGGIGIFNYLNTIITSMLSRKKEFALLECIGMTKAQVKRMVLYEGIYYFLIIIFISLICSSLISVMFSPLLTGFTWDYKFTLKPIYICIPVIFLISILCPYYVYKSISKTNLVERISKSY